MKLPQSFRYEKIAIREAIRMWKYLKDNPRKGKDSYFKLFDNSVSWLASCACCHYYGHNCMRLEEKEFMQIKIKCICPLNKDNLCENTVSIRTVFGNWVIGKQKKKNATIIYNALVSYYTSKWKKEDVDKIEYPTPVR